jgi:CheY-like chemotaxis protein
MNILLIEDEPVDRKLARAVLEAEGHEVVAVEGAAQAVEALQRCEPQAILLDLNLPGIDGLTLAHELKHDPEAQRIAVIALTAFPERFSRQAAQAVGCDGYLLKPISTRALPQQLIELVERSTSPQRPAQENGLGR